MTKPTEPPEHVVHARWGDELDAEGGSQANERLGGGCAQERAHPAQLIVCYMVLSASPRAQCVRLPDRGMQGARRDGPHVDGPERNEGRVNHLLVHAILQTANIDDALRLHLEGADNWPPQPSLGRSCRAAVWPQGR